MIAADAHGFRHQRKNSYQISELEIGLLKLVDVANLIGILPLMPESMCISCYHSDIVGIGNVLMAEHVHFNGFGE
jgi:hypothetical protein